MVTHVKIDSVRLFLYAQLYLSLRGKCNEYLSKSINFANKFSRHASF